MGSAVVGRDPDLDNWPCCQASFKPEMKDSVVVSRAPNLDNWPCCQASFKPEMKDALRAFVPTVIAARIESGVADLFVYENRKLVSVFMKAREIAPDRTRLREIE